METLKRTSACLLLILVIILSSDATTKGKLLYSLVQIVKFCKYYSFFKFNSSDDECSDESFSERTRSIAEITPKTVIQKETYVNDDKRFGALNTVDNDLSTQAVTPATGSVETWLKLGFDETKFIHKVLIYYGFFTNWFDPSSWSCALSVDSFKHCVDNDNNVDVSVYQGELKQRSCGTLQLTYGLDRNSQIRSTHCFVTLKETL